MSPLALFGAIGGVIMVIAIIGEAVRDMDRPLPANHPLHTEFAALLEEWSAR